MCARIYTRMYIYRTVQRIYIIIPGTRNTIGIRALYRVRKLECLQNKNACTCIYTHYKTEMHVDALQKMNPVQLHCHCSHYCRQCQLLH